MHMFRYAEKPDARTCGNRGAWIRAVVVLAAMVSPAARGGPSGDDILARKHELSRRLDSIELEKQRLKRRGEDLSDLERDAALLKDSIFMLRSAISNEEGIAAHPDTSRAFRGFNLEQYLPRNPFDWIVVVMGAVAVLSGVVLVVGLFQSRFGRGRGRSGRAARPRSSARPSPPPRAAPKLPPLEPGADDGESEKQREREKLERLRRRIERGTPRAGRPEREPPPIPRSAPDDQPPADAGEGGDITREIIRAARGGMSEEEISRRYHIGVDQVRLIVRMHRDGDDG